MVGGIQTGWLDDFMQWYFQASGGPTAAAGLEAIIAAPEAAWDIVWNPSGHLGSTTPPATSGGLTESEKRAQRLGNILLLASAVAIGGGAAHSYYYRGKRKKKAAISREDVTAVQDGIKSVGKGLTSSIALTAPLAYLLVETLENYPLKRADGTIDHVIGGEFGDRLQTLIASAVSADIASQLGKLIPG